MRAHRTAPRTPRASVKCNCLSFLPCPSHLPAHGKPAAARALARLSASSDKRNVSTGIITSDAPAAPASGCAAAGHAPRHSASSAAAARLAIKNHPRRHVEPESERFGPEIGRNLLAEHAVEEFNEFSHCFPLCGPCLARAADTSERAPARGPLAPARASQGSLAASEGEPATRDPIAVAVVGAEWGLGGRSVLTWHVG